MNDTQTITLESPIQRGESKITEVILRKPNAGALRGISLRAILEVEVDAFAKVLPRITEPALTHADVAGLDAVDLLQFGAGIASFFLPKAVLEEATAAAQSSYPIQ